MIIRTGRCLLPRRGDRSFGGTLGKRNENPKVQLADMDLDGIDIQAVFPTHLSLNSENETALAVDIARA
jgi:hypothetical protein